MLTLTDHRRYQPPPPPSQPPPPHLFCVDVRGWQRSRADDCIHTSAHSQRSSPAERKLHTLSATVFVLVNCALSATPCSGESVKKLIFCIYFLAGALILHSALYWIINSVVLYVPEYNMKSYDSAANVLNLIKGFHVYLYSQ